MKIGELFRFERFRNVDHVLLPRLDPFGPLAVLAVNKPDESDLSVLPFLDILCAHGEVAARKADPYFARLTAGIPRPIIHGLQSHYFL